MVDSIAVIILAQISCPELNDTDSTVTLYKDSVEIDGITCATIPFGPVPPPSNDIFGTYIHICIRKQVW